VLEEDPYYGTPDFFEDPETAVIDGEEDGVGDGEPADSRPPFVELPSEAQTNPSPN